MVLVLRYSESAPLDNVYVNVANGMYLWIHVYGHFEIVYMC